MKYRKAKVEEGNQIILFKMKVNKTRSIPFVPHYTLIYRTNIYESSDSYHWR
jgi:hypothetical protein